MVTQDVDTGDRNTLSVAVNEGVGGAVDGQAAESVRIDRNSGSARLMGHGDGSAADGPAARGRHREAAGLGARTRCSTPDEIKQLIAFADEIPKQFPQLGEDGKPVAADVEFAFVDGQALAAADPAVQRKPRGARRRLISSRWTRRWRPISTAP